ncbi:MAG: HAD-IIB family hydrolase [Bifidobacteriaceae bacterium]|jgi:HAD superfamily hydrolase (TIGR01484 family)|nr:HAD-IIB family hydrolase [Bifidobacteriaceae bacterium]
MNSVNLIAFDLDGTLAQSKSKIDESMSEILGRLIDTIQVCVISGGKYEQFDQNLLRLLPHGTNLTNLHILPTSGTRYYRHLPSGWKQVYAYDLTEPEKKQIVQIIENAARSLNLWEEFTYGPRIEDRGSQITFSALGQEAPVEVKLQWDPDNTKKEQLRSLISMDLSGYRVASGGSTSIDVTKRGVDKAYGLSELALATGLDLEKFIFVGDRLDPGGNDAPVKKLGIQTYQVKGPSETKLFIQGFLLAAGD